MYGKKVENGLKCLCVLPVVRGNRFFLEGHQSPAEREERGGREIGTSSVYCLFAAFKEVKDDLPPFTFLTFKDLLFFLENRHACRWTEFVLRYMQMCAHNSFSENSSPCICMRTL